MRSRPTLTISLAVLGTLCLGAQKTAAAKSKSFTSSFSGSIVSVPLDVDNDSCTSSPPFVCTDLSAYSNYAGKITGGVSFSGPFTGQATTEDTPVAGTGCSINPSQKSCTLGSATDACEFAFEGGNFVNQKSSTGDLVFGALVPSGSTVCVDFASGKFSTTRNWNITGGTGKFAGITGTFSDTTTGQILNIDSQGHHFAWITGSSKGTTP
jgi:hypothetical protein